MLKSGAERQQRRRRWARAGAACPEQVLQDRELLCSGGTDRLQRVVSLFCSTGSLHTLQIFILPRSSQRELLANSCSPGGEGCCPAPQEKPRTARPGVWFWSGANTMGLAGRQDSQSSALWVSGVRIPRLGSPCPIFVSCFEIIF